MLSAKATAILLITAIFNPLCCCLDLFANEAEATPAHAEMHACCTASDNADKASPDHTKADCPHETDKHSQISEAPDAHSSLAKSQVSLLSVLFILDFQVRESTAETTLATRADSPPIPPSGPLSESYCVYIL